MALVDLTKVVADKKLATRSMSEEELQKELVESAERAMAAYAAQDYETAASAMTTGWNITGTLRRRFAAGSAGEDILESSAAGSVITIDGVNTFVKGGPNGIHRVTGVIKEKNLVIAESKSIGIRAARKEIEAAMAKDLEVDINPDFHAVFAKGI